MYNSEKDAHMKRARAATTISGENPFTPTVKRGRMIKDTRKVRPIKAKT